MMSLQFIRETKTRAWVRYALYLCTDCGAETEKRIYNVQCGATKSCGCQSTRQKNAPKKSGSKNRMQPYEPIASGTYKEPLPVPSFVDVSHTRFERRASFPMWLIVVGGRVVDRQPMTIQERRVYAR